MKVKLTYFKPSGKYYSEGECEIRTSMFHLMVAEVSRMLNNGDCPGLTKHAVLRNAFDTLVEADEYPPTLITHATLVRLP